MAVLLHHVRIDFLMISFLIALIFLTHSTISLSILCPEMERQALLRFKKDLIDRSNRLSSWDRTDDCCRWYGVVCNNKTGRVEELRLSSAGLDNEVKLRGKINPSLLNLKHLTHLDLSNNNFIGDYNIPSFIGSLGTLRYLNLNFAGFSGLIPYHLGNLSSLRYLSVSDYGLYANNLHWITGLSSLEYLDMSFVNLTEASDWMLSTNTLTSLLELRLHSCRKLYVPPISYVNLTSLKILDMSFTDLVFSSTSSSSSSSYSLFKWLSSLSKLVSINLASVELNFENSSILCGLRNMTHLKSIDLSWNEFDSSIPDCLYGLSGLEHLSLRYCELRGFVSGALKNLTSIISLDLGGNSLGGKLPPSSLCKLESLVLGSNKFDASISETFASSLACDPSRLISLDLSANSFSGQITDRIGEFKNLVELHLYDNMISGPVPVSLCNLSSLEILEIEENQLSGIVSEAHLANLKNLRILSASQNSLSLRVSPFWTPLFQLRFINLRGWKIGPRFPMWLKSQKNIAYLDLSNTGISDAIPHWFWNLSTNFQYLKLSQNQVRGKVPDLHVVSSFCAIDLGSNNFDGPLPRIASNVVELNLSNNSFSGDISTLFCDPISGQANNQLEILHLGENLLSGTFPDCLTYWPSLVVINLVSNNFTGEIPSSIGSLQNLKSLHLRNNSLSGEIPLSLQNCTKLKAIDLGLNKFVGKLPHWIGTNLSELMILSLRENKFNGKIPIGLCHLASLQILDASQNNLSGAIPKCFSNFTAMATKLDIDRPTDYAYSMYYGRFMENAFVVTRGREDGYSTILGLMVSLDLSGNNFSGDFPEHVTSLRGLFSLNLSGNHFTGTIPNTIAMLTSAQSLDFSRNKLSGEIPQSVSSLNFVSIFNVSSNNLSGEIPRSTQLQGMEASNFVGNRFLCGPPLANACKVNEKKKPRSNHNEAEEDDNDDDDEYSYWFRLGISVGFGVGFNGVVIPLLIYPPWRRFYFSMLQHMWYKILDLFVYRIYG